MDERVEIEREVHPLDWDCPEKLKQLIEAAIFASQEPVTSKALIQLFPDIARPSAIEIQEAITAIQNDYADRAVNLHQSPLGYRFQVRAESSALIKTMLTERPPKYSRASLETLALIAYRQPITRGEIEEVRGVSVSSHIIRTLEEREWVRIVGHKELPGRPALWATTPQFLDYFGLNSLEDLPPLTEIQLTQIDDPQKDSVLLPKESEIMEEGIEMPELAESSGSIPDEADVSVEDDWSKGFADEQDGEQDGDTEIKHDMTLSELAKSLRQNVQAKGEDAEDKDMMGALKRLRTQGDSQ